MHDALVEKFGMPGQGVNECVIIVSRNRFDHPAVVGDDPLPHPPKIVDAAPREVRQIGKPASMVVETDREILDVLIAGGRRDPPVEGGVYPRHLKEVAAGKRSLVLSLDRLEFLNETHFSGTAEEADEPLGCRVSIEERPNLRQIERFYESALVALDGDEPLGGKTVEGFACRRPTHPKSVHEQPIVNPHSWSQRQVKNAVADDLDCGRGERPAARASSAATGRPRPAPPIRELDWLRLACITRRPCFRARSRAS